MDITLARKITLINDELERLCDELDLEGLHPDVVSRLTIQRDRAKAELDGLLVKAQRQLTIDTARQVAEQSYRR